MADLGCSHGVKATAQKNTPGEHHGNGRPEEVLCFEAHGQLPGMEVQIEDDAGPGRHTVIRVGSKT